MKLTKYAAVLATTTALVGAGFTVPTANAFVPVASDTDTTDTNDQGQPLADITDRDANNTRDDRSVATNQTTDHIAVPTAAKNDGWDNEKYNPTYAAATPGIGEQARLTLEGQVPEGTTFALGVENTYGWTVSVNNTTGEVLAKAPAGALPGANVSLPIKVSYPDGSKDFAQVKITVAAPDIPIADTVNLSYAEATVAAGSTMSLELNGILPEGTKIYGPNREYEGWGLSTNDSSGSITISAPASGQPGAGMRGTVGFVFADGSTKTVPYTVTVAATETSGEGNRTETTTPLAQTVKVSYPSDATVKKSGSVSFSLNGTVPEGTRFSVGDDIPAGWNVQVNASTGEVTVTPHAKAGAGAWLNFPVKLTFSDGSVRYENFRVTVEDTVPSDSKPKGPAIAESTKLSYTDMELKAGQTVTAKPKGVLPAGTKVFGPNSTRDGWTIATNQTTGDVTVTAPADAKPGANLTASVIIQFTDGSTQTKQLKFTLKGDGAGGADNSKGADGPTQAETTRLTYSDATLKAGQTITASMVGSLPKGTRVVGPNETRGGWTVATNENTGEMRVTAPADASNGASLTVGVTFVFADGSTQSKQVRFNVEGDTTPPLAKTTTLSYEAHTSKVGTTAVVSPSGSIPSGTKFTLAAQVPSGWTIQVHETTGVVTIKAPASAKAGASLTMPVRISYSDGSYDFAEVKFTQTADPKQEKPKEPIANTVTTPTYDDLKFTGTTGSTTVKGHVEGATYTLVSQQPGWNIKVDRNTGKVTATVADDKVNRWLRVPIRVTYTDGSYKFTNLRLERTVKAQDIDPDKSIQGGGGSTPGDSSGTESIGKSEGSTAGDTKTALPIIGTIAVIGGSLAALLPLLNRMTNGHFSNLR